ncbi:MAG: hypothetical protein K6U08_04615 [Firmicutes bacterium]|nr:hypothetical protein [Bacillota bacterium]
MPFSGPETDSWDAIRLVARDLGYPVASGQRLRRTAPISLPPGRRPVKVATCLAGGDLDGLLAENNWLLRTCRDYVEALSRAGRTLGLDGWVCVAECSGVALEVAPLAAPAELRGRGADTIPVQGRVLSLAAAGPNPVGSALAQGAVAVMPPGRSRSGLSGLGVPLGGPGLPVGCLAVLFGQSPGPSAPALCGQALFSARAVDLALALRQEQSAHLEAAAGLAHEVKNPLTAVKGFLELSLAERAAVPEYARVALRELDRAIGLLEDYSLFSRAPRIEPTQEVSVDGLLSEAALLARGLVAGGPPVTVAYVRSDPDLVVLADPPRLKQVLLNLCRNAVEAMSAGGLLTLRARRDGGEAVLEVSDTGVGIAPSDLGRVFEPFYTTKEGGSGLGLAVCRRVIEAHGGRVLIRSTPGRGTTAEVRLPLHLRAVR